MTLGLAAQAFLKAVRALHERGLAWAVAAMLEVQEAYRALEGSVAGSTAA